MATITSFMQHLRRTALLRDETGLTDGQLLGRFIEHRDEDALASLVRRHGPMVWGVCRRLLTHHDAEDAFQATFLFLVRKAASILPRERVANWLYGVAHQTALQARRNVTRRRAREKQMAEMPEPAGAEQDRWDDLRPFLDQELSRLRDKYRAIIVLCDLEGKTRKEVARQLGLPEGTIGSRLARARTMLAKRLTQRGITLSGGALAAVLSQKVASAGVPTSVVSSTIKAVTLVAAGQAAATGAISVKVAALTEGVLKTMLLTKLKTATAGLVLVSLALGGGAGLIYRAQAAGQAKALRTRETIEHQKTEKVLESPVDLNFTNVPLHDVVDGLRSKLGRNIFVDELALAAKGISLDTPVTLRLDHVTLKTALKLLLDSMQLVYTVVDDVIVVTTPEKEVKLVIKVYPVDDLTSARGKEKEADPLMRIIANTIAPTSWNMQGGEGSMEYYPEGGGSLVIRQSPDIQKQVQDLLDTLRKTKTEQKRAEQKKNEK